MNIKLHPDWLDWPQTQTLVAAFANQKTELRFVGGAVRDALLGVSVQDVDAATTLLPDAVMALLEKAQVKAIPTGIDHGTVTAVIGDKHFEITTLRKDVACDGRHAEVSYTDDWQADAARRDFTMNAMYLTPAGELFDYFGGSADAEAGCVRFIGEASKRIAEDYLRILRFFRFSAWYGKQAPDRAALAACATLAGHMDMLSGERIQAELLKLLAATEPSHTLRLMQEHGILPHAVGFEVRDCEIFARLETLEPLTGITLPPSVMLAGFVFAGTFLTRNESLDILSVRLKLPAKTTKALHGIIRDIDTIHPDMTAAQQKRALRRMGAQPFTYTVMVGWAYGRDALEEGHPYYKFLSLAEHWQIPPFPVTGDDLIALGIKPGKKMGELLSKLEEEWEQSDYRLTKKQLLAKL